MTKTQIFDEVKVILQDNSQELEDLIPGYIDEAFLSVADEHDIPALKSLATVTTVLEQAWVAMPEGFNGRLLYVGNADGPITIDPAGLESLLIRYPGLDEEGDLERVALEGTTLWYQKIPSTQQLLTTLLYKEPEIPAADAEYPAWLPKHLQRGLLAHRAAALAYDKIEDGIDGEKVNTAAQLSLYQLYSKQFNLHLAKRRRGAARSIWSS